MVYSFTCLPSCPPPVHRCLSSILPPTHLSIHQSATQPSATHISAICLSIIFHLTTHLPSISLHPSIHLPTSLLHLSTSVHLPTSLIHLSAIHPSIHLPTSPIHLSAIHSFTNFCYPSIYPSVCQLILQFANYSLSIHLSAIHSFIHHLSLCRSSVHLPSICPSTYLLSTHLSTYLPAVHLLIIHQSSQQILNTCSESGMPSQHRSSSLARKGSTYLITTLCARRGMYSMRGGFGRKRNHLLPKPRRPLFSIFGTDSSTLVATCVLGLGPVPGQFFSILFMYHRTQFAQRTGPSLKEL